LEKLEGNAARDIVHQRALRKLGWKVVVVWECENEKPGFAAWLERRLARVIGRVRLTA
jgi:G:T-mismatch repair DNA endonuclease (very short patch repair protein)